MEQIINFLYAVLASPATTSAIALIAIITTFRIYYVRKKDEKRDAANIILLEIRNAETNLEEAQQVYEAARSRNPDEIKFPEKLRLMKTESWTKYKYLFVRDFEDKDWQAIGNFYDNCLNFDEAVEHKDTNFFQNESAIRTAIHTNIAAYSKELADGWQVNPENDPKLDKQNESLLQEILKKKEMAVNANIKTLVELYNPDKSFTDAAYYFNILPKNLTNTPLGKTLKDLAYKKSTKFIFWKK